VHVELAVGDREPNRQAVAGDDEGVVSGVAGQLSSFETVGRYNLCVRE
jgi:hypothetical protein